MSPTSASFCVRRSAFPGCSRISNGGRSIALHLGLNISIFLFLQVTTAQLLSMCVLSHVQLFSTPWTVAYQAPLSMGFSRQEYWSGMPFSPPEDLLNPVIKPTCLMHLLLAGGFFTNCTTWHSF